MDVTTSAKMAYTAVSLNEKQAKMKEQMGMGTKEKRRRGKREKDTFNDECDDDDEIDSLYKFDAGDIMWKAGLVLASFATAGTNIFNLMTFMNPLNVVAATSASGAATTVAYTEITSDTSVKTVKGGINLLRRDFAEVHKENLRQKQMVDELREKEFCAMLAKDRLVELTGEQDLSVQKIRAVMTEYHRINRVRRSILRMDVKCEIVRLVMKCDSDESGKLDKKERKRLIQYLRNLPSVRLDEKSLLTLLTNKSDVWDILAMINLSGGHGAVLSPSQPIVIDLDCEALSTRIEQNAQLRQASKEIDKSFSSKRQIAKAITKASAIAALSGQESLPAILERIGRKSTSSRPTRRLVRSISPMRNFRSDKMIRSTGGGSKRSSQSSQSSKKSKDNSLRRSTKKKTRSSSVETLRRRKKEEKAKGTSSKSRASTFKPLAHSFQTTPAGKVSSTLVDYRKCKKEKLKEWKEKKKERSGSKKTTTAEF